MEYRNARFTVAGHIDCEIKHSQFGWIPFTANPDDTGAQFDVAELFFKMSSIALDYVEPTPPTQAEVLADERSTMKCSRLQGRLVLGEATCTALDAIAADPATPWAMRQTIQNAIEWSRMSQSMTELGYLLGYTDTQMDDLFRLAMTVDV